MSGGCSSLRTVGLEAFCGCKNLKDIKLSDELEEIGVSAFRASGLESVAMP